MCELESRHPARIAIIGYYNARNSGDDRMCHVLVRLLEDHYVYPIPHDAPPSRRSLEEFDWVILGGGSIITKSSPIFNGSLDLKSIRTRIGVAGIGVSGNIDDKTIEWTKQLVDTARFFYVRDQNSKRLLGSTDKIKVYPDLTWVYPVRGDGAAVEFDVSLALAPCPWKHEFQASEWIKQLKSRTIVPFPMYFRKKLDAGLIQPFFDKDIPQEFSITPLSRSRLLIASRLHAIIFAIQLRKPFVGINYDDKVANFLDENELSEFKLEAGDHELLPERIEYILKNYEAVVERINTVASRLESQAQVMAKEILGQIASGRGATSVSRSGRALNKLRRVLARRATI